MKKTKFGNHIYDCMTLCTINRAIDGIRYHTPQANRGLKAPMNTAFFTASFLCELTDATNMCCGNTICDGSVVLAHPREHAITIWIL